MRHRLVIAVLTLGWAGLAGTVRADEPLLRPGALLGAHFARLRDNEAGVSVSTRSSFGGGLSLEWRLPGRWALDTRLLWLDRGSHVEVSDVPGLESDLRLRYLALPLLLKVSGGTAGRARPYLAAGPEIARRHDARLKTRFEGEEQQNNVPDELLRRWDLGLYAAAGVELPLGRAAGFADLSASWGLRNQSRDIDGEGTRVRTRGLLLSAGLRF